MAGGGCAGRSSGAGSGDDGGASKMNGSASSLVVRHRTEVILRLFTDLETVTMMLKYLHKFMSCIVLVMTIVSRYFDGAKMQYLLEMLEESYVFVGHHDFIGCPHIFKETQALFDLYMMYIDGVEREEKEWESIFSKAGFSAYKIMPILGFLSIIEVYP
uniref:O-methyltransferase domain-containing protein n=1 Tax=Oryza rufipogon TaxID=4529 RepID=A0A0E0PWE2_ORYRU